MKASLNLLPPIIVGGVLLLLPWAASLRAAEGCPPSDGPQILRADGDAKREIWLFEDSEGIDDAGLGKVGDFQHCQPVLDIDEVYQTIQLLHPSKGKVWIMRTGIGLTTDAHVTCLAEDNESVTMGGRGMGEGCDQ